jgi:putative ABC transport system permease protein
MNTPPLTTLRIAAANLKRVFFRTACLSLFVALLAFTLFGGGLLLMSLENGVDNLSQRLGADILAVPSGYEADIQSALLRGEPSTFYFPAGTADKIAAVRGVSRVSPQIYIATLNSGCCAYPVQLIGFDPGTDFIIQPWISNSLNHSLMDGEIVVGSSINALPGQQIQFYNRLFAVAARLDKTGMGFDTSIFMNLTTAKKVTREAARLQGHPLAEDADLISSVMVRIDSAYEAKAVANAILQAYAKENIHVVVAKNMISAIAGSLRGLSVSLYLTAALLWIFAAAALVIVFSVTLNSRRREFSIYRVLGAPKSKLVHIILCEASLTSLCGALAGIAAAALLFFPFSAYIKFLIGLPYLRPSAGAAAALAVLTLLVSFAVGPLASAYGMIKIGKSEIYRTIREGE